MLLNLIKSLLGIGGNSAALQAALANKPLLLDVRTKGEFAGGSVPGAVNIPVQELETRLGELREKNRQIVVFCRSGARSGMAKSVLERSGFGSVVNGGSWQNVKRFLQ